MLFFSQKSIKNTSLVTGLHNTSPGLYSVQCFCSIAAELHSIRGLHKALVRTSLVFGKRGKRGHQTHFCEEISYW